jgi:hypothetical protein
MDELFNYLKLLVELEKNGYTCKREIQEAINAIRRQFGFVN